MIIYVKSTSFVPGLAAVFLLAGCASVLDEDGALAITPYKIEEKGRIVVAARVNDQGPFDFALDTAASISVVFDDLRYELGLETIPDRVAVIHGAVATGTYPLLDINRIDIGRATWTNARIVSLPGDTMAGVAIDGVLGVDFLRQYAVGFSTRERVIRLYPPQLVARKSYRGWASVPLEAETISESGATVFVFEIEIDGRRIPAVFDLGAGLNLMNWRAARRLGIDPARLRDVERVSGQDAVIGEGERAPACPDCTPRLQRRQPLGIGALEEHRPRCQTVDVRRADPLVAIAPEIVGPERVRDDEDDVHVDRL